jgi:hypothetical protein
MNGVMWSALKRSKMSLLTISFALTVAAATAPGASAAESEPGHLPPKGSWQAIALTCEIAGGELCASQALGGMQMLEEIKQICPAHNISADEAWSIVNKYYSQHSERRRSGGGLAAWVYEAAVARFGCTIRPKP